MPSDSPSNASGIKALVPIALDGVWRGRTWVIAATIAGTLFGVFRAIVTPSEYRSIGKLQVRPGLREVVVPDAAFAGETSGALRMSGSREAILNELQILASPDLFDLVVQKIGADAVLAPYNPVVGDPQQVPFHTRMFHAFQTWWFGSGEDGSQSPLPIDRNRLASIILSRRVVIVPETGTSVISVYFHAGSPERARVVVNGVLEAAKELHRKVFETMSGVEKIEEEYRVNEGHARAAESALREFRVERDLYDFNTQHDALLTYLGTLNRQIDDLDLEIKRKQGEVAALRPILANHPPQRLAAESQTFVANPQYAAWSGYVVFLREQLVLADKATSRSKALEAELATAVEQLGKEKPLVKAEGIQEPNPEFMRIAQRLDDLEIALKGDEARRQHLVALRNTQRTELNTLESLGPQFRVLDLDAKQKRAAADQLAEGAAKIRAVERLEQLNLSNIQILQGGTYETEKIAPARAKLVVFGAFGGGAFGTAFAVLLALLGSRVRLRADLIRLGVPEHQTIRSQIDRGPVPPGHGHLPPELAEVRSDVDTLWATLPYDRRAEGGLRVACLRTGTADSGRTAACLAIGLALYGGERVAYVATSHRGSWLARTLGLAEDRGWGDVVVPGPAAPSALPLQPTRVPGLEFCAAGSPPEPGRHPLAEPAFVAMLDRLAASHRFVIVDLPDLGTRPEARAVLGVVDAAYLVTRSRGTTKAEARAALAAVSASGARLMGCVLQPAESRRADDATQPPSANA
jgi:uncharacterized protein involved in exopolysaccharide biosynthesis